MEKIASFTIDHTRLLPGVYVSRRDGQGDGRVTTFDLRLTVPNREPVMDTPAIHTIEHLGATFLRSGAQRDRIVYFGPMGCRTGFYLILFGEVSAGSAAAGDRHVPFHPGLFGRYPRRAPRGMRQLSGAEPGHGQVLHRPLSARADRARADGVSGVRTGRRGDEKDEEDGTFLSHSAAAGG